MNNTYRVTVESPLLRPGIKIETECSERYVVPVLKKVMDMVREVNSEAIQTPTESSGVQRD